MDFCLTEIAASIEQNCAKPIVAGYTGRAVLIPWSVAPTFTTDSTNPRIITAITLPTGAKVVGVNNVMADPFSGTSKASSADSGFIRINKTLALKIPQRGAAASKDIVEPLLNSAEGFLIVLEKRDKVGDGSYEIIGYQSPLKCNADGLTHSESENGGCWSATMSCTEVWGEVVLCVPAGSGTTSYDETKEAFEDLLEEAY